MKRFVLLFIITAFLSLNNKAQTVTDIDGNIYNTVIVGTQEWMAANLNTTRYDNGINIPGSLNNSTWQYLTTGARSYYNNDSLISGSVYGMLYNWYAVSGSNNLCPSGWRVPTNNDWTVLINYVGGLNVAGGILKEKGTAHWIFPNTDGTNEYNFTALPGGLRHVSGPYQYQTLDGWWWSSTSDNTNWAWNIKMLYDSGTLLQYTSEKKAGFSVRCLRDITNGTTDLNYLNNIRVFPNPAIDKIIITCTERQDIKMAVYNIIGDCIMQDVLNNSSNEIDISSFSNGIYIIKLSGTNWTVNRQLTKL